MLHNEARELLVAGYEKTHDAAAIAEAYSVSIRTVYRLVKEKRERGSVELRTSQRGRKAVLSEKDKEAIRQCIDEQSDITVEEIRERLELSASYSTVERAINAMGYTLKEMITPDMVEHMVFLDESGININLTRLYGWAPSSRRARKII